MKCYRPLTEQRRADDVEGQLGHPGDHVDVALNPSWSRLFAIYPGFAAGFRRRTRRF